MAVPCRHRHPGPGLLCAAGCAARARWPHSVLLFAAAAVLPFFFSTAPVGTASTVYRNAMADLPLACLFGGALCLYQAAGGRRGGFFTLWRCRWPCWP